MLKRPSSRRKSSAEGIQLNLIPILDTMVTLIAFILFTTSFMGVVSIESPFPVADPAKNDNIIKERPLQLSLSMQENESRLWSPFAKIPTITIPNVEPNMPDVRAIHEKLLEIKRSFPNEKTIVFEPRSSINYDTLVAVMDATRMIEPTDPPIFAKNAETGNDEALKDLFSNIVFGNLLANGD